MNPTLRLAPVLFLAVSACRAPVPVAPATAPLSQQQGYIAPFSGTGDKPYLKVNAIASNGHALTWDGRVDIQTAFISPSIPVSATPVGSWKPGSFTLQMGQSLNAGTMSLTMQSDCNAVLNDTSTNPPTQRWASNTAGQCTKGTFTFQSGGNVVLYDEDVSPATGLFSTSSGGWAVSLDLYQQAPYIAVLKSSNVAGWEPGISSVVGWAGRAFRPEYLAENPSTTLSTIATNLEASFSAQFPWAVPDGTPPEDFTQAQVLTGLPGLNALGIAPQPGYAVNPYRSDASGNAVQTGAYLTYQMTIITENYNTNGANPYLMTMPVTTIVQNPFSTTASIVSMVATANATPLLDTTGSVVYGIEPTVTFDGQLVVYNHLGNNLPDNGAVYYTSNPTPGSASGWVVPQSIVGMNADATVKARGYPLARYPLRDAYGALITNHISGAYPWISPEGADLFFSAVIAEDGARRAGTVMIGGSTKGMLRHIDGAPNVNRTGESPMVRLFVSSLGLTPGMWSSLELQPTAVLPLTDKRNTYPMFSSNSGAYFEVSAEETLAGDYDAYLDMAEVVSSQGNYDTNTTQDISGNFHDGQKNAGALFAEEAYPAVCSSTVCPVTDPGAAGVNLFSGKAIYFQDTGLITVPATSATGHQLLVGGHDLTVSVAVLPLQDLSGFKDNPFRVMVAKNNTFNLILEQDRKVSGTVYVESGGTLQSLRITFAGTALPVGSWSHVTMTYATATSTMTIYVNGVVVATQVFAYPGVPLNVDGSSMQVGPNADGEVSGLLYALDQVGVSRVVRTPQEIARQATLLVPRLTAAQVPNPLPVGIAPKDVHSPILTSRALNATLVSLGQYLFFDPLMSPDTTVACVTCHLPSRGFTENLILHPSRLIEMGLAPHTPRNTPGLFYLGLSDEFFFDGRAADLPTQAQTVLSNPVEMGPSIASVTQRVAASKQYQGLFETAFPGSGVTTSNLLAALQEFELSLSTLAGAGNSRFDQYMAGNLSALSAQELQGKAIFFGKAHCAQCHTGTVFSDASFHTLPFLQPANEDGVSDTGRAAITFGTDDAFKFATPSLRNVALTAPYFHDGSSPSLADVVARYNSIGSVAPVNTGEPEEMLLPINLTSTEQAALVAFLGTLSSSLPTLTAPHYTESRTPAPSQVAYTQASPPIPSATTVSVTAHNFNVQPDGNIVVYDNAGNPVWASGSGNNPECAKGACQLALQSDGNLELTYGTQVLWSTNTGSEDGPFPGTQYVVSSTEPYLEVLDAGGSVVWSSSNRYSQLNLAMNQFVRIGSAQSGAYLVMQGDENFVYYAGATVTNGVVKFVNPQWSTGTVNSNPVPGSHAAFQGSDGNLVIYEGASKGIWASNTSNPNSKQWLLLSQKNPYLSIETETGEVTFSAP